MPSYQKGDVRIRYEEAGSGFPLLVTPGGGLNSPVSNWPTAVINAMEAFKNDFRCITIDQRNANGGESSGPIAVADPCGAFPDDPLGPPIDVAPLAPNSESTVYPGPEPPGLRKGRSNRCRTFFQRHQPMRPAAQKHRVSL